jgi:hypothetical protein
MPEEHEIRTVTTLKGKRTEIERAIKGYKRSLEQARADLGHINAAIVIFEAKAPGEPMKPYDGKRLFRYNELAALCLAALQAGAAMFRHACAMGLEGIVSKRVASRYKSGSCLAWVKVKNSAYERR